MITDVITPGHFFVHNASSPDYALLSSLNCAMNDTFGNNKEDVPEVDLRTVSHGISFFTCLYTWNIWCSNVDVFVL